MFWIEQFDVCLLKNQVDYLRGLITMESMVIICLVVSYILLLADFHKKQLPPDMLREDITNSAMLNSTNGEAIWFIFHKP